ncbi:heterokaryon incompatibility protein-domain-containing protein [Cubamyces menziesii]|nr:heterokaryon incompatibility protein-domain-containing protein [Cubamyces menziesii]
MWLLRTDRAELVHFNEPPPKYAILSHVWGQEEQSFQDLQVLLAECHRADRDGSGKNPRSQASAKVRACCMYAEADGYDWLWEDTCCIDKTSSAELSEAINSMYTWYSSASVCYAYLADVPADDDPAAPDSAFRRSAWFGRSWTLQELIAPQDVLFLSKDWQALGNKYLWPGLLEEITGVDADVLTFLRPLSSIPISTRMRWASGRQATRIEDEAYSLMGIFQINMPTIYGEGRRAFRRLQEEIMRQTPDQTLFLWGGLLRPGVCQDCFMQVPSHLTDHQGLLADAPSDFANVPDLVPIPYEHMSRAFSSFSTNFGVQPPDTKDGSGKLMTSTTLPEFTVTSHGIRARLPVIEPVYMPTSHTSTRYALALLACAQSARNVCPYIALLLRPHPGNAPVYHIGLAMRHMHTCLASPSSISVARYTLATSISHSTTIHPETRVYWKELYITSCSSDAAFLPTPRRLSFAHSPTGRPLMQYYVIFPPHVVSRLRRAGFETDDWLPSRPHEARVLDRPHAVFAFTFSHVLAPGTERFRISVGLCPTRDDHGLWAAVDIASHMGRSDADVHHYAPHCDRPHLVWADDDSSDNAETTKKGGVGNVPATEFGDGKRKVHLSVGRSDRTFRPTNVALLIVHIELGGLVYEQLRERMVGT